MRDCFMTIPLVGGTPLIVNPSLISAIFFADPFGQPVVDGDDARVAMMVSGNGNYCFFLDFHSPEEARSYILMHKADDNRT